MAVGRRGSDRMLLVVLKFVEVFARAGFIVGTSYSLGLADAGRFGLLATLVGLFAFAFNWERHVDIQRRHAWQFTRNIRPRGQGGAAFLGL